MKKIRIILAAAIVFIALGANAQWNTNGDHIYNNNSGFVGIGTNSPSATLDVFNSNETSTLSVGGPYLGTGTPIYNIGVLNLKNTETGDLYYIGFRKADGAHEAIQSVYDATTGIWRAFSHFNVSTRKYEIRHGVGDTEYKNTGNVLFNNAGSVGIGTTEIPSNASLAVNGSIYCKELEISLDGWADHVFQNDYYLRPLSEVEEFINENNHLPGIPSQKEITENGLSVGEMNRLMMEKIEELTLYVIELEREIELLKEN